MTNMNLTDYNKTLNRTKPCESLSEKLIRQYK